MVKKPKGFLPLSFMLIYLLSATLRRTIFSRKNWLYEAITETYIPLIKVFEALTRDDVDFRLTMSISPHLGRDV